MSLYYVKGTPGSGKSTIRKELAQRGFEAHDADDDDMGGPYNNATNQRVTYPDWPPKPEWFAEHSYRLIPEAVQALHDKAKDKLIFLCGTASNEDDVWHLFDSVLFLDIDEATLKERIASRTDNDYGQTPHELELIMEKYRADKLKRDLPGVIIIDASLPVSGVVQAILDKSV